MLVHLILSQRSLRLPSVLFILFTLFCSSEVISTILSSSSLICSSASDILLLIPSRVFLISVIVLFGPECLFFNSYRSLLITCIFSILFSRFLITFTTIILNIFSGNLPSSSSFIWTSVFLVCSFIFVVFLCLFIIYFKLTVFKISFSQASSLNSFFLFISALLKLIQVCPLKVCASFVLGEFVLSFCLFVFPLIGKAE